MGIMVYLAYYIFIDITSNSISTIISIFVGAIIYAFLVLRIKILTKEDIYMIPFGSKIYSALVKLKIYRE